MNGSVDVRREAERQEQSRVPLSILNELDHDDFSIVCGGFYEHSQWIMREAWNSRPFDSLNALVDVCRFVVDQAGHDAQVQLICEHPDLFGRFAREGTLTSESMAEQSAAGFHEITADEQRAFEEFNAAYRSSFGFPFVICARENGKEAILEAIRQRLEHDRKDEIRTALDEIHKIARLRMNDAVDEER